MDYSLNEEMSRRAEIRHFGQSRQYMIIIEAITTIFSLSYHYIYGP